MPRLRDRWYLDGKESVMIGRLMAICLAVGILGGCSSIDLIAHGFKAWGSDDAAKSAPKEDAPPAIPPSKEQAAQRDVIRAEELPPP